MKTFKYLFVLILCCCDVNGEKKTCTKLPNIPKPTTLSVLRKNLTCRYAKTPPTNATNTRIDLQLYADRHRMEYYGTSEFLFSYSFFFLVWHDDRLKWDKTEYKNRSHVYMRPRDIWTPSVSASGFGYFRHPRYVLVFESGEVNYLLWWEMTGHCKPAYAKWADKRICEVSFQLEPAEKLLVSESYLLSTGSMDIQTSWGIVDVKEDKNKRISTGNLTDLLPTRSKFDSNLGLITFELHLERNMAIVDATLFSPAAVLFILVLASTWIPCSATIRLSVLALTTLLEIFLMHFATRAIPTLPGRFSDFAVLYRNLVMVSGISFFEWYVAYIIACKKLSASGLLQSVAGTAIQTSYDFTRTILFIPSNPAKVQNGTPEGAFLAVILDRIAFLILLIVFIIIMVVAAHQPRSIM